MPEQLDSMRRLARQVGSAPDAGDLSAFSDLLNPDVRWGPPGDPSPPCTSKEQVFVWYGRGKNRVARAQVVELTVLGDCLLVGLVVTGTWAARERGGQATRWQVLTVRDSRIVDIVGFEQRSDAVAHAGVSAA